jgi:hypothetical protein
MAQAIRVVVKPGEEVRGVDISVKKQTVTLPPPAPPAAGGFKISGVVVDGLLPRVGSGELMLGAESDAGPPRGVGTVIIGGTPGSFEIPSVQPGKYDLFVRMAHENGSPGPGGGVQAWGRTTVEVTDQDVTGVRLVIHASVDVSGIVKIDGKPAPSGGKLRVGLSPIGVAGRIGNYRGILDRTQAPDAEGKVTILRAAEGNYQVFVQGADDLYISDVRHADASVLADGIAVRNVTPAPFEVLLLSDGGSVQGTVSNDDKSPAGGSTVILIPDTKEMLQFYRMATAGLDGKFAFRGVRPGSYKVVAGSPASLPLAGLSAEILATIQQRGTGIIVKTGSTAVADIGLTN